MSTSAPKVRIVDALSGAKAPTEFFAALSEADQFCAELDDLHELRTRVEELTAERDELDRSKSCWKHLALASTESRDELGVLFDQVVAQRDAMAAERDDLADRLHSLNEAHQITIGLLATARNERDGMRWEVSR